MAFRKRKTIRRRKIRKYNKRGRRIMRLPPGRFRRALRRTKKSYKRIIKNITPEMKKA